MNPADCFSEIKIKSTELVLYLENLISSQNLPWQEHFGFEAIPIDNQWIERELSLKEVNKIHLIKQLGLLKIPSKSFYNWHVDDFRQSCINMLISKDHHSYSIFGDYKNSYYHNNIIELKYNPFTYYLFNNQKKHAVVNLDCKDRYLLSLYFEEETSYDILRNKLQSTLRNE